MNEGHTVFAQLLDFLPKYEFDMCVARYHDNFRIRKLPAYEQFLVLAFAQLTWRKRLRDVETCLASFGPKLYHSGMRQPAARWPTPTKNGPGASLPASLTFSSNKPPRSTPTSLSASNSKLALEAGSFYIMDRGYLDFARLHRLHQCAAFFVTRTKTNFWCARRYSRPGTKPQACVLTSP